jgi:BlaI family transcriptional regulator, penicillinase repressor
MHLKSRRTEKIKGPTRMPRKPQDVTDAELAVLEVLWDRGTATVRDITETLYPRGPASDVATVQKLLQRLEQKSWVRRNRDCWPHLFEAAIPREGLIDRRLQNTADTLCEGSLEPLVTHLVRSRLGAGERRKLRLLLDELDKRNK